MVVAQQAIDDCKAEDGGIGNWDYSILGGVIFSPFSPVLADDLTTTEPEAPTDRLYLNSASYTKEGEGFGFCNATKIEPEHAANDNKETAHGLAAYIKKAVLSFARDEDAAITVAFVLWVPVFVLILALTVDATVLFISQANMWSVARDTSRFMAIGLYSTTDAEAYAAAQLPIWGEQSTIVASRNANFVTINLSVPIGEVAPFNISGIFTDGFLVAELSQRVEPN